MKGISDASAPVTLADFHYPNCGGPWVFRSNIIESTSSFGVGPFVGYKCNIEVEGELVRRGVLPSAHKYRSLSTRGELCVSFGSRDDAHEFCHRITHVIKSAYSGGRTITVLHLIKGLFLLILECVGKIRNPWLAPP